MLTSEDREKLKTLLDSILTTLKPGDIRDQVTRLMHSDLLEIKELLNIYKSLHDKEEFRSLADQLFPYVLKSDKLDSTKIGKTAEDNDFTKSPDQYGPLVFKGNELLIKLYAGELTADDCKKSNLYSELLQRHVEKGTVVNVGNMSDSGSTSSLGSGGSLSSASSIGSESLENLGTQSKKLKTVVKKYKEQKKIERQNFLTAINCMIWSIYHTAIVQQDKVMERGSFKIIDPDSKLHKLLEEYIKFVNDSDSLPKVGTGNKYAYCRVGELWVLGFNFKMSSHTNMGYNQFGIDMRLKKGLTPAFPGGRGHMLSSEVFIDSNMGNKPYTTIKLETVGLGTKREIVGHLGNYVDFIYGPEKSHTATYRESDVPQELIDIFNEFTARCSKEVDSKMVPDSKEATISDLYKFMSDAITNISTRIDQQDLSRSLISIKDKFEQVAKSKELDHIEIRAGEEIILDFTPLANTGMQLKETSHSDLTSSTAEKSPRDHGGVYHC